MLKNLAKNPRLEKKGGSPASRFGIVFSRSAHLLREVRAREDQQVREDVVPVVIAEVAVAEGPVRRQTSRP